MNTMNDDFYGSIDRLVEFGLSGQLAKAMIQTMNEAMANMQMPNYARINQIDMTNPVTVAHVSAKRFFVAVDGVPEGPLDKDELKARIGSGKVNEKTLLWYKGLPGWVEASKLEEVGMMFVDIPPLLSNP